jgi:hypothetical protein
MSWTLLLKNTRRFAQHLEDSKVLRCVEAVIPKADEAKLQDIMESAPPVAARNFVVQVNIPACSSYRLMVV